MDKRATLLSIGLALALVTVTGLTNIASSDSDSLTPNLRVEDAELITIAGIQYGEDEEFEAYAFPDGAIPTFRDLFPNFNAYRIVELDRHGSTVHAVAVDPEGSLTEAKFYDLTVEFNNLTADAGLLIESSDKALKVAKAYAEVGNYEQVNDREFVNSSHSAELGVTVEDPTVTALVGGWDVTLSTYTEDNGIVAEWNLRLSTTEVVQAEYSVQHLTAGEFDPDWEDTNFEKYDEITNNYQDGFDQWAEGFDGSSYYDLQLWDDIDTLNWTTVETNTTFDGSTWEVEAPEGSSISSTLATALASAGNWSYGWLADSSRENCGSGSNPNPNWGYTVRDADCRLKIRVLPSNALACGACIVESNETVLYVAQDLHDWMYEDIQWYRSTNPYDVNDTARLAVWHLFFVHLVADEPRKLPELNPVDTPGDFVLDNGSYAGTLAPEHFALRAIYTDMFQAVEGELSQEPNFANLHPVINGTEKELRAIFQGEPPSDLREDLLPTEWTIHPYTNLTNRTTESNYTAPVSDENITLLGVDEPAPDEADSIGPGSLLASDCTSNFVWTDDNGTYYLGGAGHCYDNRPAYMRVCVKNCSYGSIVGNDHCVEYPWKDWHWEGGDPPLPGEECVYLKGEYVQLPMVYQRLDINQYEVDFALARIPEKYEPLIDPSMPRWNGPQNSWSGCWQTEFHPPDQWAEHPPAKVGLVFHYGNAQVAAETWLSKARAGFFKSCHDTNYTHEGPDMYSAQSLGSFGDSGSAVNLAWVDETGVIQDKGALGVLDRLGSGKSALQQGPTVDYVETLLLDSVGWYAGESPTDLRVVTQGETIE